MAKFMIAALALIAMVSLIEASPVLGGLGDLVAQTQHAVEETVGTSLQSLTHVVASIHGGVLTETRAAAATATPLAAQAASEAAVAAVYQAKSQGATREVAAEAAREPTQLAVQQAVQAGVDAIRIRAIQEAILQAYGPLPGN